MIEEECKADNSLAKQTCSKFQVLIAVTWLTLAPDQGLDCVSYLDHERWGDSTTLETRFMKMQPNHLWTLQQGHLHLLWSSKLKPLQLLMKWCSWECWLIPDSGMEFQIFFHPLIVQLPFLIHAVHFYVGYSQMCRTALPSYWQKEGKCSVLNMERELLLSTDRTGF